MRESPRRLRGPTDRPLVLPHFESGEDRGPFSGAERQSVLRRVRAIRRGIVMLLWTLPCIPVQTLLVMLPGRPKIVFARIYWAVFCRALGLRVRVIGTPVVSDRKVIFVSNHSSWLDVPVLGGQLEGCFVAKEEVSRWPLISTVARLGRTVFVSRQRGATLRERDSMRGRLAGGDRLILFPEGTTSDGSRVLPFRSAFFAVAEGDDPPLIQPISVAYDRLGFLPTGRASRPLFAWYGDMDIASHYWRLAQHHGLRASILLHAPIDPARFPDRKALAHAVWQKIADGASTLRQNRPAEAPGTVVLPELPADGGQPAYA